ncbi:acyl-CoA dehydrogenase [Chthonomonas calidirosea]|uniref:Acyl-CoA dehydrogenases n=1 Tax=Chthonomonas calidirosea (strain DSM 23976 / ICMP 18418 / T49) TaxID=1303518 RepID=S0EZP3_CHTCT|nr:acyl-CoA dehydrogenase family protein [Chthonomonas calidirosea]CCW36456.1 Acyl-CoA dehydrogenases [Chthonomonas calidirosea T49]CEK17284.1 acyl-CoA dehydrogenase [Chthonomonas calidirosea]
MMRTTKKRGGAFLLEATLPEEIFVPEMFTAEDRLIGKTAEQFLHDRVLPHVEAIEHGDHALVRQLMQQAGELGLLAGDVPEVYGGLGLSQMVGALIAEKLNFQQSFALTHEVQTVLGALPLLYFGNHEQKSRYLPKIASGEWIAGFALSEARSGSDVLGMQTRATPSADGLHFILNGEKMWITNAGIADLFTVFARTGEKEFTAFLVERSSEGLSLGREEHKLGMHGTSTRRVIFEAVKVPKENAFADGLGHHAAFCALNMGRLRLEAGAVGGLKQILALCASYAKQRKTFGRPIADYGLIRHKLAEMAGHIFALESMVYRLAGDLEEAFSGIVPDSEEAPLHYRAAAEEFALECCVVKVLGSEAYSYLADEAIQLHGGYGYTEELPFARAWRDQRLLRIGEGANELLRIAIVTQLMRRGQMGVLPLWEALAGEGEGQPLVAAAGGREELESIAAAADGAKRSAQLLLQGLTQREEPWREAQEIVAAVADVISAAYGLESLYLRCLRCLKLIGRPSEPLLLSAQVAAISYADMAYRAATYAVACLGAPMSANRPLAKAMQTLRFPAWNPMQLRRQLAEAVLEADGCPTW